MSYFCYLLNTEKIIEQLNIANNDIQAKKQIKHWFEELDYERQKKYMTAKTLKGRAQSLGSGLLIRHMLEKMQLNIIASPANGQNEDGIYEEYPQAQYMYNESGKPYFKNYPYFFNISHSENMILGAISDMEIGVDIQIEQECNRKLVDRFFHENEKKKLSALDGTAGKEAFFKLWTAKEAYGKLVGSGVSKALNLDMSIMADNDASEFRIGNVLIDVSQIHISKGQYVLCEQYDIKKSCLTNLDAAGDKYYLAVCRYIDNH